MMINLDNATMFELGSNVTRHATDINAEDTAELFESISNLQDAFRSVGRLVSSYKGISDFARLHMVNETSNFNGETAELRNVNSLQSVDEEEELSEKRKSELMAEAAKSHDDQLRTLTKAIKEMVIVNKFAPKPLSDEEAVQSPLKVLNLNLKGGGSRFED
jgi:Fic family protein